MVADKDVPLCCPLCLKTFQENPRGSYAARAPGLKSTPFSICCAPSPQQNDGPLRRWAGRPQNTTRNLCAVQNPDRKIEGVLTFRRGIEKGFASVRRSKLKRARASLARKLEHEN